MKIEQWKCDRCKKVFDTKEEVLELRVQLVSAFPSVFKSVHVCLVCGKIIGFSIPPNREDNKKMADKLLDIIYDIVGEAVDNR